MPALDPSVVAAIDDLELVARLIVEGARAGRHRSPFHGFSTEFSQHRAYRAGDDFRHLDWKLLARTDRLYTRQFRETTNLSVMLVVDASASMDFPRQLSKFRYATMLAAALAYLIVTEGDRVGLLIATGEALTYLPPKGGRPHLRTVLAHLERAAPQGAWQPARAIAQAAERLDRRGLLIVLSDFYDAESETDRELRRAARRGHDVTMMQILSRPELAFEYSGAMEFEDLESGEVRLVDAGAIAGEYRDGVKAFLERSTRRARVDGIDHVRFMTDLPLDHALRSYLIRRGSSLHASHETPGSRARAADGSAGTRR